MFQQVSHFKAFRNPSGQARIPEFFRTFTTTTESF